jgi:hypothetical protein
MNRPHRTSPESRARALALLQAIVLAASLIAAPILHPHTCTGPCAAIAKAPGHAAGAAAALPPCHTAGHGDSGRKTCDCTGDCCSFQAQFVAPSEIADVAAPTTLFVAVPAPAPDDARRAPEARLLPFPTGPPPTA